MKTDVLFVIGCLTMSVLLTSCQSTVDLPSDRTKDELQVANLIEKQGKSNLNELSGTLHPEGETTSPQPGSETPDDGTQESATPTSTPMPVATSTPPAVPGALVTVPYAEIFPGGSEMSRNRPLDFAIKIEFGSSVGTELSLKGFFIYQGQEVPSESTCGQIPERSLAGFTWSPAPTAYGPGNQSLTDWGNIPMESIPVDATHLTVLFTIKTPSDDAIHYCLQKTYLLTDEPSVPPAPDDPSAIKVMSVAFWPDTATANRYSTFDFGARLDFESIVMTQARLLAFFTYQGQELPGESTCMSGQMPGQSGGTFWSTGTATRLSTGINHFEQPYTYSAAAPNDATHLVMWLMLEGVSGKPILCWQKVIELSAANQ